MKILVHDYVGYAFVVPLSRALAQRGHDVLHTYCGSLQYPQGVVARRDGDPASLAFQAIELPQRIDRLAMAKRWNLERKYGELLIDVVRRVSPDVIISADAPSLVQARLVKECRRAGVRVITWVQDLYGVAAYKILRKKIPLIGAAVGRYFMRLDRHALLQSDGVVLITDAFREQMEAWGVPDARTTVIPNWAPLEDLPQRAKDNAWSREHGLHDKTCFVYTGTLSLKHNPELLLQLALHFKASPDVRVVVVSQGASPDWLAAQAREKGLSNLIVLPFQPYDRLPEVLAMADVLVAVLEPDAGAFSVPSKVLSYLCAGRPILASIPPENLAARTVTSAEAGFVTACGDDASFLQAAQRLLSDRPIRERLGQNGRYYATRHFDVDQIAVRFERVMARACLEVKARQQSADSDAIPESVRP